MIGPVMGKSPRIHASAFVAPGAVVLGEVELGPEASIWYGCVLRGDVGAIRVGARSNVQDLSLLHVQHGGRGTEIGTEAMIGHRVVLHDCRVEDRALVGNGAVVLDGAVVREGAVVAAGSLVAPGSVIPARTLALGAPARPTRPVSDEEAAQFLAGVRRYVLVARCHATPGLTLAELETPA